VVVGATGRTGLGEHLLGSTTERVARSVDASVLIARP
jgi:nucleotide-binding universal stress UspA family protein